MAFLANAHLSFASLDVINELHCQFYHLHIMIKYWVLKVISNTVVLHFDVVTQLVVFVNIIRNFSCIMYRVAIFLGFTGYRAK